MNLKPTGGLDISVGVASRTSGLFSLEWKRLVQMPDNQEAYGGYDILRGSSRQDWDMALGVY